MLFGAGFIAADAEASAFLPLTLEEGRGEGSPPPNPIIRHYRNGRDLTDAPRGVKVIDAFGLTAAQLHTQFPAQFPAIYQRLLERVKPERDANRDLAIRDNWYLHGRTRGEIRKALVGLPRCIASVETAKHRTFQFVDASILPGNTLVAIASADAFDLAILSGSIHISWSLATGGTLEARARYNKSRCFEAFPFPAEDTGLTPALRSGISNDALLTHLVALNAQRAEEENAGNIRWLRPHYQNRQTLQNQELLAPVFPAQKAEMALEVKPKPKDIADPATQPWPTPLPDQVRAVVQILASQPNALSLADMATHFKSRGAWKKSLPQSANPRSPGPGAA